MSRNHVAQSFGFVRSMPHGIHTIAAALCRRRARGRNFRARAVVSLSQAPQNLCRHAEQAFEGGALRDDEARRNCSRDLGQKKRCGEEGIRQRGPGLESRLLLAELDSGREFAKRCAQGSDRTKLRQCGSAGPTIGPDGAGTVRQRVGVARLEAFPRKDGGCRKSNGEGNQLPAHSRCLGARLLSRLSERAARYLQTLAKILNWEFAAENLSRENRPVRAAAE